MIQFILRHVNYSARFSLENGLRMGPKSVLSGLRSRGVRFNSAPQKPPILPSFHLAGHFFAKIGLWIIVFKPLRPPQTASSKSTDPKTIFFDYFVEPYPCG